MNPTDLRQSIRLGQLIATRRRDGEKKRNTFDDLFSFVPTVIERYHHRRMVQHEDKQRDCDRTEDDQLQVRRCEDLLPHPVHFVHRTKGDEKRNQREKSATDPRHSVNSHRERLFVGRYKAKG